MPTPPKGAHPFGRRLLEPAAGSEELKARRTGINARFREEVIRIQLAFAQAGLSSTVHRIGQYLGLPQANLRMVLSGTQYVQTSHIRRLYDVLHGDYWYVLFGVPNPDAEQRGHYLTPAAPRTEWSQSLEQMGDWIAYRYMKEVERLEREGRIINRQWLCEQLGVSRTFFMELRKGKIKIKPEHIQALKDVFNADFHFILWGVERPDISLPFRLVQGRTMRIDVYPKYIFTNRFPAEWGPNIPERDPEDEVKRIPERAYYLDLKAK